MKTLPRQGNFMPNTRHHYRRTQEGDVCVSGSSDRAPCLPGRPDLCAQGECDFALKALGCVVLDAIAEQLAVLATDGTIIAVNAAWTRFGAQNNGAQVGVGSNYLALCRSVEGNDGAQAAQAAQGIGAVLAGQLPSYTLEYDCDGPTRTRRFCMSVTPLGGGWRGAVVLHHDITERHALEMSLRIAAIAFESPDAKMVTTAAGAILKVNQAFTRITGYSQEEVVGKSPSILNSGRHDARFYASMWAAIGHSGSWEGEIWNRRKNGDIYPEHLTITAVHNGADLVSHYVASFSDVTVSKAANDEIKSLAFYDPLTRLPNRRLLLDRLGHVLQSSARDDTWNALVFIDLDNFKTLNDTLGHATGDLLLQEVARRLLDCVRQCDTVARLGGDEFLIILERLGPDELGAAARARVACEKILYSINQPFVLGQHNCVSSPSLGITLFHGEGQEAGELLKQADIAMYEAKKSGRNALRFFDQKMQDSIAARSLLEDGLRRALREQQFRLHYQVQVDAVGRPVGAEALIRWQSANGQLVSPGVFIPLAEETGQILAIGEWVLHQACAKLRLWQDNPATRHFDMAVNISAKQFNQSDFQERAESIINYHGVVPNRLKFELTEGILLENTEATIACMNALRAFGVRFSMDDFGTGYCSLQYLKRLPISQLKIDQSFVRDLVVDRSDVAIVRTIIAMAAALHIDVIAEGVETAEQRLLLFDLGCANYQGYLFGKPMSEHDFALTFEVA